MSAKLPPRTTHRTAEQTGRRNLPCRTAWSMSALALRCRLLSVLVSTSWCQLSKDSTRLGNRRSSLLRRLVRARSIQNQSGCRTRLAESSRRTGQTISGYSKHQNLGLFASVSASASTSASRLVSASQSMCSSAFPSRFASGLPFEWQSTCLFASVWRSPFASTFALACSLTSTKECIL